MEKKILDISQLDINEFYIKYKNTINEFEEYRNNSLPLCAAENIISEFSKQPLINGLQERYILGGHLDYDEDDNMIGSKKLLPFYEIITSQCSKLFNALYTDCRSLSGMNALQNILLSLMDSKSNIMILSSDSGGHAALPNILDKLSINYINAPFDYESTDYDYKQINNILTSNPIDYILLAPTDIIFLPDFSKFNIPKNVTLIFDASQILAFYINNPKQNPLNLQNNVILIGGTHKTIPGVAKALIMTNNEELAKHIDSTINPLYLRNTHIQNVASLILTLIEMEYYATTYCEQMIINSNYLGKKLSEYGFEIINRNGVFSETHQLFIHMNKEEVEKFFHIANTFGISLNKKNKKLFHGNGIRIGVQEITRYGWGNNEIETIAEIFFYIKSEQLNKIPNLLDKLKNKKHILYTFKEEQK